MFHRKGIKNHEKNCVPMLHAHRRQKHSEQKPVPVYAPPRSQQQRNSPVPDDSIPPSARFEFPKMLYKMLEDCTFDEDYCRIVSWQSHGLAFKVHNRDELEKILHRWFREKYESFRCLLEQWGFVKLSRGKDRGCWYQKKFYHVSSLSLAKKKYDDVEKADFIKGVPEYLSPRDEPDLDKESTIENRISSKKRKAKALMTLLGDRSVKSEKAAKTSTSSRNGSETTKEKTKSSHSGRRRYDESTHKECRYCHGLFAAQGFAKHEESCSANMTGVADADVGDDDDGALPDVVTCRYCGVNFSKYGVKKHEMFCQHANDGNLSESESESKESDNSRHGLVKCRYCDVYFSKYGIGKHESCCKGKGQDKDLYVRSLIGDSMEHESEEGDEFNRPDVVPCNFCGEFFSKYGVKKHEFFCKEANSPPRNVSKVSNNKRVVVKGNETTSNYQRSALSDDSSVSSNESGCRMCGFDDDHANLLLCEGCDTELHTYCLNPPLDKVPEGDWFCDTCKARIEEAEINMEKLMRHVPPEMEGRFGEICFAKSAESAHWWPALIFDPRSFLHNPQVVELARRNLGKRYLVFFFENQDAFAAIPKTWIVAWEEGVKRGFDKGKSVRHASKARKGQFERAMDLANEAFADVAAGGYSDTETEFGSQSYFDNDHYSRTSDRDSVPREIDIENSNIELDPNFDWRAVRDEAIKETKAASPSQYPKEISSDISKSLSPRPGGRYLAQRYFGKRVLYIGTFLDEHKAAFAIELFLRKMRQALCALQHDDDTLDPRSISDGAINMNETINSPISDRTARSAVSSKSPSKKSKKPDSSSSFGTFTDKRPYRPQARSVARGTTKAPSDTGFVHSLQSPKKVDPLPEKTELQTQIPPRLSDIERDKLLLSTSLCHYYLLPLTEL